MPKKNLPPHEIIKSEELSSMYNERYIVINPETGEVLDDAQGYGYKSRQKAHAGFGYKATHSKSQTKKEKARARAWWANHKSLSRDIESEMFYALKDREEFTYEDFKEMLKDEDLRKLTPRILWRYF